MLSVSKSAEILGVSPARVRKLLDDGLLEGRKIGRAWAVSEESVYDRLAKKPGAGRPLRSHVPAVSGVAGTEAKGSLAVSADVGKASTEEVASSANVCSSRTLHDLYLECKEAFRFEPSLHALSSASQEDAGFYMAVADYFLQQKQRDLIERGAY